jgi:hypothetical protein
MAAQIRPGQLPDGLLVEDTTRFTKRGTMTTLFAPLSKIERHGGMLLVEATGRVAGAVTAALCGALRKIADRALGQMHNPDAAPAGRITGVSVDPGGAITIKAQITDRPAQQKTSARVYPGISIRFDGDEVDEVSIVDRDFSKLSKGVGAADTVLVKIHGGDIGKMNEEARKALAAEAAKKAAVQEIIDALGKGPPAVQERALWAAQIELCKTHRLPRIMPQWAGGR